MYAKGILFRRGRSLGALLLAAAALSGCRGSVSDKVAAVRLTSGPVSPSFAAVPCPPAPPADPAISLAYADPQSRTVALSLVTLTRDGEVSIESSVLDRIAEGSDASTDFGSLAYACFGDTEYLSYLDRAGDGSLALKRLQGPARSQRWEVDLTRPPGRPLCYLSEGTDIHLVATDSEGIFDVRLQDSTVTLLVAGARPEGPASVSRAASGDTFTVLDAASGTVLAGRLRDGAVSVSAIRPPRGYSYGRAQHSRLDDRGRLCLLFYDTQREEIVDLLDAGGARTVLRVTRAREVAAVCAVPWSGGTLYLYAETARTVAGHPTYAVSLIRAGGSGKASHSQLRTSAVPFGPIQASVEGGELRVITLADSLLLLRVPLGGTGR